ncbi:hypothetical protein AMECASPLE_028346 [Ameca splendens]|uniref:Uncharacterized protein n=1 Tax=Ameca splendens TaxID=208324 RepID=A0ABV0YTC3_9TELE
MGMGIHGICVLGHVFVICVLIGGGEIHVVCIHSGVYRLTPGGCLAGPLPWQDLLRCSRVPAGPAGMLLQLPGASALWLWGWSPGLSSAFHLGGGRHDRGPPRGIEVLWMSVAPISSLFVFCPCYFFFFLSLQVLKQGAISYSL